MEDTKEQPKIRKAEKEDYREIAGFMQQVHDLHSQARPDIYKDVQHFYTLEQFAEDMANPEILFLTASIRGKLVGMCEMKYHTAGGGSITRKRQRHFMSGSGISKRQEGRSLTAMERLLMEAEAEARRRNIFKLELTAWHFNQPVLEFYKNYGLQCQKVILEKKI